MATRAIHRAGSFSSGFIQSCHLGWLCIGLIFDIGPRARFGIAVTGQSRIRRTVTRALRDAGLADEGVS
jgi:hypothetical protein